VDRAPTRIRAHEHDLLEGAQAGDEGAFEGLVGLYRGELHAHCYRMLGSLHDADDAMQEVMLRAWRALARFEGRSSVRSWLYTIATNASLNLIARRPKRVLPIDYGPPTDPADGLGEPVVETVWPEPYPDDGLGVGDGHLGPAARYEQREAVELAFIAALQHLPPNQRAVLILRDVLGFSARETALALDTTVASANSALQRARDSIDRKLPSPSQQATLRAIGDDRLAQIVESYMDAMASGDVDRVVGMLAEDAVWSMPPLATWFRGPDLPGFLANGPLSGEWRWRHLPARANGQPAVAAYVWDDAAGAHLAFALDVLAFEGDRISAVTAFITRASDSSEREFYEQWPRQPLDRDRVHTVFERFGLPATLPAGD
jgi:RNA polymerase sigma-70 factor, ECF subfamily